MSTPLTKEKGFSEGLENIVATTSAITFIDGETGVLAYRGYLIEELAQNAEFEEVTHLLWHGALPTKSEYDELRRRLAESHDLAPRVIQHIRNLPKTMHPMDALRTAISVMSHYDPDVEDNSPEANERKAIRLVAQTPSLVAAFDRIRNGKEPIPANPNLRIAANLLYMLTGEEPDPVSEKALEVYLVLLADHEFNASTFAARVTAATLSDMHSAVVSGISALKGPLHGGANEKTMELLLKIGDPAKARATVEEMFERKEKIMGIGHRVYKVRDPRTAELKKMSKAMCDKIGRPGLYEMSDIIEQTVWESKRLLANVDFYSATVLYALGLSIDIFTPLFAVSRMSGWSAHIMEQHAHNRLIRPRSEYIGPAPGSKRFVPMDQR
ncbi:MAG: citrate/2-methylcitrate synthase [Armatimonadota bacterium]|nr:citrate/2-methylcitrate synthase [Armatimonadota bacterium]